MAKTVSVELAKRLKAAGLRREAQFGDWMLLNPRKIYSRTYLYDYFYDYAGWLVAEEDVWLPTLSDVLEELEERGHYWEMYVRVNGKEIKERGIQIFTKGEEMDEGVFVHEEVAVKPEDAAGEALLWALKHEKEVQA